jgi:hypothetical protein
MFPLLSALMLPQVVIASHAEQPTADQPSHELFDKQLMQTGRAHAIISNIPSPLKLACSKFVRGGTKDSLPLLLLQYLAEEEGLTAEEQQRWQQLTQLLHALGWPTVDSLVMAIRTLEDFNDTSPLRWSGVQVDWDININAAELERMLELYITDAGALAASKKVLNTVVKLTSRAAPLVVPPNIAAVVGGLCDMHNSSTPPPAATAALGSTDSRSERPLNYFWFLYA